MSKYGAAMSTIEREVMDPEKAAISSPSVPPEIMRAGAVPPKMQTHSYCEDIEQGIDSGALSSTGGEEFEVRWIGDDDDPLNPRSMSKSRKWLAAWVVGIGGACV